MVGIELDEREINMLIQIMDGISVRLAASEGLLKIRGKLVQALPKPKEEAK